MKQSKLSVHGHRRFHTPSPKDQPRDLFTETYSDLCFRRIGNKYEILIFIAACSLHATTPCRAVGYGIKVRSEDVVPGYLEQPEPQSRNRAALRAAVRAIHLAQTSGIADLKRLILAGSSEYLVMVCPLLLYDIEGRISPLQQNIIQREL